MNKTTYFLRVLTPLHVGTGSGLGHIDLPIYREAHTDFPAIPSSSIKGVLRTEKLKELSEKLGKSPKDIEKEVEEAEDLNKLEKNLKEFVDLFGNKKKEGSLSVIDARIFLFPVKSLKGIFAYVTCPYALNRFFEELEVDGKFPEVRNDECLVPENSLNLIEEESAVILEEFILKAKKENFSFPTPSKVEKKRIVIVSDDVFKFFVKNYTEVQTHIRIDIETGTVEGGALWTEEYVPAESVFYFQIIGADYEITNKKLQLGGNSTTGKGFVEVEKYENR